jgi:hypothetical protein
LGFDDVRFGICGINDFNKLLVSRKPNVRSDPQRLFGAVSRKNTDDEIARDIIAGYMGDVPVEERIEFLGLALWAMRLALKHPDRFQVLSGLCLLHDCLTWTRREWLRRNAPPPLDGLSGVLLYRRDGRRRP